MLLLGRPRLYAGFPYSLCSLRKAGKFPDGKTASGASTRTSRARRGSPVTILFLVGKSRCPASVRRQASGRPGSPVSLGLGMGLVRLFFQSAERVSGA